MGGGVNGDYGWFFARNRPQKMPFPGVQSGAIDPAFLGRFGAVEKQLQILRFAQDDSSRAIFLALTSAGGKNAASTAGQEAGGTSPTKNIMRS
jgi:hypothetical protein